MAPGAAAAGSLHHQRWGEWGPVGKLVCFWFHGFGWWSQPLVAELLTLLVELDSEIPWFMFHKRNV